MTAPTDADNTRQFRLAARLMAALAAGFFALGGVAVAVAMPDERLTSRAAPFQPAPPEPPAVAAAPAPAPPPPATLPAAEDPNAPLVVKVTMGEFFFAPKRITAPAGRLIRFEVSNPGVVSHEFLIGDRHTQDDAEAEMAKGAKSGKGHTHADSASIYLDAGESGVLEATFDTPGELLIGCHVPGHWSAGMEGTFTVTAS
jgi:uncharacterized cupredoxin-like copper-binding protein